MSNEPAFPHTERNGANFGGVGMTLRDYFAAKAMQGDLIGGLHQDDFGVTAKRAYIMADEMLEARSKS
jgi:hypothetical protein